MTIEELKNNNTYCFECNIDAKDYKDPFDYDEWGCAYVWFNKTGNVGVEYNFCIDGKENYSAIYKMEFNKADRYMRTDYEKYISYHIDFSNHNWKTELEIAMCKALLEFYNCCIEYTITTDEEITENIKQYNIIVIGDDIEKLKKNVDFDILNDIKNYTGRFYCNALLTVNDEFYDNEEDGGYITEDNIIDWD